MNRPGAMLPLAAAVLFWQIGFGFWVQALNAQQVPLFTAAASPALIQDREAAVDPSILRSRLVRLNRGATDLYNTRLKADSGAADVMILNLFEDVSLKAVMEQKDVRSSTSFTALGHVEGMPGSSVTLVMEDGVMAGNVRTSHAYYQVRYVAPDLHAVREIDETQYPEEADPIPVQAPDGKILGDRPPAAADDGTRFDVLVVYTPAARAAAGGTTAMNALINLAVAETNTAYARSGVMPRLRLVRAEEVDYQETNNFHTELNRLTDDGDGFMDNVHVLRNAYGADLVALLVEAQSLCGLAWVMTNESSGFERFAFSVTSRICATGNYTFGHELGHNMGLQHDRADTPENGVFPFSHGYVDVVHRFRTIMGVQTTPPCCSRIQNFSNPNVSFGGFATGVPQEAGDSANAAASINAVRFTVANWRTQADGFTLDVSTTGPGSGTIVSNIAGISCGSDCSEDYSGGSRVILTAAADAGSVFRGWSGACSGTGRCTVTMNGPKNVTATFAPPLSIAPNVLPSGEVGLPYNGGLAPAGGISPLTVSVVNGALPRGLGLVGTDIVGTPTASGVRTFTIKVRDQLGGTVKKRYTLRIRKAPAIVSSALKGGTIGRGYTTALEISGGTKPFTWSGTDLPPGLNVNPVTGEVTGTPVAQGVFASTFHVVDALGASAQAVLTVRIR